MLEIGQEKRQLEKGVRHGPYPSLQRKTVITSATPVLLIKYMCHFLKTSSGKPMSHSPEGS